MRAPLPPVSSTPVVPFTIAEQPLVADPSQPGGPEPRLARAEARAANEPDGSRRSAVARVLSNHGDRLVIVAAFVVSRFAFRQAGVRFDPRPLNDAFQLLDRGQLRDHLFSSLVHLHSQPPLFNLFIGLGLHAPHFWEVKLFRLAYWGFGLALALTLYAVLRRVGVSAKVGVVVTVAFMLDPSVFLYENWLHYDYPVTLLLCLAVLALLRYEDGHRLRDATMFLAALAVLVLTRSLFHIVWFVAWAIVLLVHRRHADWRRVAAAAAVPLVVVVAVHLNNMRISGSFTSSTSLGMSMAKITTFQLPERERRALVARGQLSPLALVDPLSPISAYRGMVPWKPPTGVPVLDDEAKGTYTDPPTNLGFYANFNNINYVQVSNGYLRDALRTIRMRPGAYVEGVARAYNIFFRPAGDFFTLFENRQRAGALESVYDVAVDGMVSRGPGPWSLPDPRVHYQQGPGRIAWLAIVAYAVALVWGARAWWRRRRSHGGTVPPLVLAFLWSTVAYVMVVSNAVEVGENNRFRLYTEPLVLVLLVALVVGRGLRGRSASDGQGDAGRRVSR